MDIDEDQLTTLTVAPDQECKLWAPRISDDDSTFSYRPIFIDR